MLFLILLFTSIYQTVSCARQTKETGFMQVTFGSFYIDLFIYCFCLNVSVFRQVLVYWYTLHKEGVMVKTFLEMLKKWEAAGFINGDIWLNLNDMIDSHTIESAVYDFSQDNKDNRKLSPEDYPDGRVLGCVAPYVLDSRTLHFAVDMLGLPAESYSNIEDLQDDKHLMNLMVCHMKLFVLPRWTFTRYVMK